jgi:hypothetical protein
VCGSFSRTKKDVAALDFDGLFQFGVAILERLISAAASLVTPSRCPSSTCCLRIQFRSVSNLAHGLGGEGVGVGSRLDRVGAIYGESEPNPAPTRLTHNHLHPAALETTPAGG